MIGDTLYNTYLLCVLFLFPGNQLKCTHNISDVMVATDICGLGLQPDYINVNCSVDYHGNKAPALKCNQEDAIPTTSSEITHPTNVSSRITYSLTMQVNNTMNGTHVSCHIPNVGHSDLTWLSPLFNILCKSFHMFNVMF